MSTKKKTQTTSAFDATGKSAYDNLQSSVTSGLQTNMNNPYSAMAFNSQLAQGNQSVFGATQANNQNTVKSLTDRGISANSPLFAQQVKQSTQAGRNAQNGVFNNLLLTAGQVQTGGAAAASQYQPLQTGNTSVNGTSGLGTWLPQVAALVAKGAGTAAGA
jgi:hypothetical protein